MKIKIDKIWELTSNKFFVLTLVSHIGFVFLLFFGSAFQIISTLLTAFLILLLASVPVYHRFLSHRSWNCPRWYEVFASLLGMFSFTGSTISRTVTHRQHHAFVDTDKDPHSPQFTHWLRIYFPIFNKKKISSNLARDLIADPLHRVIHKYYLLFVLTAFLIVFLIFNFNWAVALTIAPGALCWANVCILNIFGHSDVNGTNNKLLSILTLGEGNHNDHHIDPANPNTGGSDFDLSYFIIKIVEVKKSIV